MASYFPAVLFLCALGISSGSDVVKVNALLCNLPEGPKKISEFKNCSEVTLSIERGADITYAETRVVRYRLAISPKDSKIPQFVEEFKGNIVPKPALERISSASPGDLIVLTHVRIQTAKGIREAQGARYTIIPE